MSGPRAPLALALVAALLAPGLAAASDHPTPDYPEPLLDLYPELAEDAEALVKPGDEQRPWWPSTKAWLDNATAAAEAGRFRIALFDLETFTELVLANQMVDEASALPNDAERKSFVLQRTTGWKQDGDRAWLAYRAKLHGYDGQLHSLHTIETALYSADLAISAGTTLAGHPLLARDFPQQAGFPFDHVLALVRYSHTPLLKIAWADRILDLATAGEGTPPRIDDVIFANVTRLSLAAGQGEEPPAYLEDIDALARPARENNESTLAVAILLAEQRALRLNGMQTQFGDAQTRRDVLNDAATFMGRRLENTTLETPRSYGLQGVFTSDAIDRAQYALEFHARNQSSLPLILATWAGLDHSFYVIDALGPASPVKPQPPEENDTPLAPALAILGIAAVALALRRRRG